MGPLIRCLGPKVAGVTRTEEAIDRITAAISGGRWKAGDRLPSEAELAAELGLSRSSLREAVRALELVRVLDVRHGDGTYVTSLEPGVLMGSIGFVARLASDGSLAELFEVRRLLEPAATALAAVRMDPADRAALGAELERMDAAEGVEELVEADAAFHLVIYGACGNRTLASLLESLSHRTMRARLWRAYTTEGVLDSTRAEHVRIHEAVMARDPELARTVAATHVANTEHWLRRELPAAPLAVEVAGG